MRKLAIGGMAEVFLAKSGGAMGFSKTVVVKRILPHLADDQRFVEMFLREAKIAAELTHPNVVQIFDFGESDGRYFIAMEYVDGPSLRTLLKRSIEARAPIPFEIAARLVSYACEGLGFAHALADPETGQPKDIVHRDISPDNILISRTGAVKVADFGLAKAKTSNAHTQAGMLKGKIPYLAPEQIRGKGADRRADIWALGVTLYELCAGRRPFDGENEVALMSAVAHDPPPPVQRFREDVPDALAAVVDRTLKKAPDQRYQTCREMQSDLDAFLRQKDITVGPFELAAYITQLDAIPRTSTGRHFPAAAASAETVPTRPERDNKRTPSGKELPSPPQPARPPPTVTRVAPIPTSREPAGRRSFSKTFSRPMSSVITGLKAQIARVPPERRPFVYGGAAAVGLLLVVLAVSSGASAVESMDGPCTLEVDSVPTAQIRINLKEMGRTPKRISGLPAGPVAVEVYDPAVPFSKSELMNLAPGHNGTKRFIVAREPVELRIFPQARVAIDGKDLGKSPVGPIQLYEGKHRLTLTYEGTSVEHQSEFEVRRGGPNVVKRNLVDLR